MLFKRRQAAVRARGLINSGRIPGGQWYEHHLAGSNLRLTEFQAALLRQQLRGLRAAERKRSANVACLIAQLASLKGIAPVETREKHVRRAYHLFNFRYQKEHFAGLSKRDFAAALRAEGIPLSEGYQLPLYRQPLFKSWPCRVIPCPVSEKLCAEQGMWLHHSTLLGGKRDIDDIATAIEKVQRGAPELVRHRK